MALTPRKALPDRRDYLSPQQVREILTRIYEEQGYRVEEVQMSPAGIVVLANEITTQED